MAESVNVQLGLNSRGFVAGLNQAKAAVSKFASSLGSSMFGQFLGAAGVMNIFNRVTAGIRDIVREAGDLRDAAEVFGGDVSFTQQLKIDAEEANVSFEKLQNTFVKLAQVRAKALGGSLEDLRRLAGFGIGASELAGMTQKDMFQRIRAYVSAQTEALTPEQLTELAGLGFAGRQIPLLRAPPTAADLYSDEQSRQLDEADKALNRFWRTIKMIVVNTVTGWMDVKDWMDKTPTAKGTSNVVGGLIKSFTPWGVYQQAKEYFTRNIKPAELTERGKTAMANLPKIQAQKAAAEVEQAEFEQTLDDYYSALATRVVELHKEAAKQATVKTAIAPESDVASTRAALDTMAQMGAFVGGAAGMSNPMLRVQQDQLSVQRDMRDRLSQIAAAVEGNGGIAWS